MLPLLGRCYGRNFIFKIKTSISCMFPVKRYINMCLMLCLAYAKIICLQSLSWTAMEPTFYIPNDIYKTIAAVHNSKMGHHGLHMCKK